MSTPTPEQWLLAEDRGCLKQRADQLAWLLKVTPPAELWLFPGGWLGQQLFEEARYSFIYGQFVASAVLGFAHVEARSRPRSTGLAGTICSAPQARNCSRKPGVPVGCASPTWPRSKRRVAYGIRSSTFASRSMKISPSRGRSKKTETHTKSWKAMPSKFSKLSFGSSRRMLWVNPLLLRTGRQHRARTTVLVVRRRTTR
jgi:hypothetical protein